MDEQSQNAHDELTDQDQFRMSHHMYHLPPRKRRLYKRSLASSRAMRMRGLPPTEYWQRQRISMRRGYYSTFCRIWQDGGKAPKGGFRPPVLSLRGGAKPRRGNPSPALSVGCADSSPTGGAKLGLSGPHRPLPPPPGGGAPAGGGEGFPGKKEIPRRGIGD